MGPAAFGSKKKKIVRKAIFKLFAFNNCVLFCSVYFALLTVIHGITVSSFRNVRGAGGCLVLSSYSIVLLFVPLVFFNDFIMVYSLIHIWMNFLPQLLYCLITC